MVYAESFQHKLSDLRWARLDALQYSGKSPRVSVNQATGES